MTGVQLASAAGPEAFARIMRVPEVEVPDLGALGGGDTEDAAGGDVEGVAGAGGEGVGVEDVAWGGGDEGVEGSINEERGGGRGREVRWLRVRVRRRRRRDRWGRRCNV